MYCSYKLKIISILVLRFSATFWTILAVVAIAANTIEAGEFLSTNEVIEISGFAAGTALLGQYACDLDSTRTPLLKGPLPLESTIQRFLGGEYNPGQRNFLDNQFGQIITPVVTGTLLLTMNLIRPQADKGKKSAQDLFLFTSGLLTTKGITDIAKGIVSRPRPYITMVPAHRRSPNGFRIDRSSFISGHTSGAFFSAAYLNLRLRAVMRSDMSSDEYLRWHWVSPTVLFGWASFVGLSRIHAYKHYFSDILIGALVGYLVAELFFSFGENNDMIIPKSDESAMILRLNFTF